jgi:type VI protein secretion system component VasF
MRALGIRRRVARRSAMLPGKATAAFRNRQSLTSNDADHRERGDVPGWVMITLMSAVLVAALLALAGPALEGLFNQAMDTVGK